jgi:asparagine synthase (glutamine-hydrolysing)
MCGIAGYRSQVTVGHQVLASMVDALRHRGPDSSGFYRSADYAVGMKRLSINDLVTGGQPLFNEDQSVVLFYNGEIYNSPRLRIELQAAGHSFRTQSDGEVICHMYEEYGPLLFERLDGMFAAALWSERERTLILARDLPGEKPLYYAKFSNTELAFASEIKSLVEFPFVDLSLDEQSIWDFPTFLWIPEPRTVYRSIRALPPGHLLIAAPSGIQLQPYSNRFNTGEIGSADEEIITETRRVVTEAIESRLLSDVPVGCFLSSGLDSSIVAAVAAKAMPSLSSYTIAFEDVKDPYHGHANEADDAERYAELIGTRHRTIPVTAEHFRQSLPEFCKYGDQPFGVSSGLGILAVARAAREDGVKVLLSGDGADECFGGYSWYPSLERVSAGETQPLADASFDVSLQNRLPWEALVETISSYSPRKRAWALHYYASESEKQRLFNREFFDGAGIRSSLRHFDDYRPEASWTSEDYITQDRGFYFPNEMLRKVDRMTMAHSVEARVPFAAPAVLSHAAKLRYHHMFRDGTLKWVLRKAFADVLPTEVVSRPKHGFNVPIDFWLRSKWADLVDEAFAEDSEIRKRGLVGRHSGEVARELIQDSSRLNGHTVFCFIMLNLWLRG